MQNKDEKINKEGDWYLFNAEGKVLGRLSTEITDCLRGKKDINFAANVILQKKVVVINCSKVTVTGRKAEGKKYHSHSGFHGGLKTIDFKTAIAKDARFVIEHAVKGMLPQNKLRDKFLGNLYLYNNEVHPHTNAKFVTKK